MKIVLTGPTGWIGTAFLAHLSAQLGPDWSSQVTLFGSRTQVIDSRFGSLSIRALEDIAPEDVDGALVVHLAYLTKDKIDVVGADAFFSANWRIDSLLLSALERARPKAVFVASSGAAAQAEEGTGRELYGVCKLLQEDRFSSFSDKRGVSTLLGRIFNLAGPFINKTGSYAVSSFLEQGLAAGTIQIKAAVPVYRSYLHVLDMCELVILALDKEHPSGTVDLCGGLTVEMEDVAREAARALGIPHDRIERGAVDWLRPSLYLGDPTTVRTMALRYGRNLRDFARQVDDTAYDLRERVRDAG